MEPTTLGLSVRFQVTIPTTLSWFAGVVAYIHFSQKVLRSASGGDLMTMYQVEGFALSELSKFRYFAVWPTQPVQYPPLLFFITFASTYKSDM